MTYHSKPAWPGLQSTGHANERCRDKRGIRWRRLPEPPVTSFESGTALQQACNSDLPASEMDAHVQATMDRLRRARGAFQSELVRHAAARTRDTDRLAHLRTLADTGAKQADALIGTMRDRQAAREQIKEAEDLRLFFRLAVGYTAALLNAGPS